MLGVLTRTASIRVSFSGVNRKLIFERGPIEMRRQHSSGPDFCEQRVGSLGSEGAGEPNVQLTIRDLVKGLETQLRQLADTLPGTKEQVATNLPLSGRSRAASVETVRSSIRDRSQRDRFFPSELFADPAWDMLLDLYLSEIIQRRVSVSSLCIASNVPDTTALRWIASLERDGLIERTSDPFDKRRYFMSLTGKGRQAMDAYFSSLLPAAPSSNEL